MMKCVEFIESIANITLAVLAIFGYRQWKKEINYSNGLKKMELA